MDEIIAMLRDKTAAGRLALHEVETLVKRIEEEGYSIVKKAVDAVEPAPAPVADVAPVPAPVVAPVADVAPVAAPVPAPAAQ